MLSKHSTHLSVSTRWLLAGALACAGAPSAHAAAPTPLTIATWNLGWHLDSRLASRWVAACGQRFAKASDGLWRPDPNGPKTGWQLRWGRNAKIDWDIGQLPPCNVWQSRFRPVAATEPALAKRRQQIAQVLAQGVNADVIAFQEVSGEQAVREVLPDGGRDYEVCSFEGYKVQRLAFAWRRQVASLVGRCEAYAPLSLPEQPVNQRPRPGLSATLRIQGKTWRFMTVHLKSSCVSPLEGDEDGRGQLDGDNPHCQTLQAQLQPLEQWLTQRSQGVDGVVLLGDFNRNVALENALPANSPVRSRGKATDPYTPGVRSANLWREVNDGDPVSSRLTLLETHCSALGPALNGLCGASKQRVLTREEMAQFSDGKAMGCRNPIGLDHIAVRVMGSESGGSPATAEKIPLGRYGQTREAQEGKFPDPLLAVSDHCPVKAVLR